MGRTPVASGSSVPAWPAFLAEKARLTTDTAWVDVMPIGLSRTIQPSTFRFSRFRCGLSCTFVGWLTGASLVFAGAFEIALDRRRAQQLFDPLRFVEPLVEAEMDIGREFEIHPAGNLTAQEFSVAVQRRKNLLLVTASQRHHVCGCL